MGNNQGSLQVLMRVYGTIRKYVKKKISVRFVFIFINLLEKKVFNKS